MNKPCSAFAGDLKQIKRVYTAEQIDFIRTRSDLQKSIITHKNLASLDTENIEIIFSTWGMPEFSNEDLSRMPNLKIVFYAAGATDYFCRPLLINNIHVVSAWRANAVPVAEYTVAQIILGLKNYFQMNRKVKSPLAWHNRKTGCGAYGRTVAFLGAGVISKEAQKLLKNYDLNVIEVPSRKERRTISMEEAFRCSQVVSNHLPDREDNAGVITGDMFASMPENGIFINTGRGRQVNEKEMIEVLKKRNDLTALLDVTYPEPPEEGSELYTLENVFLSPHLAGSQNDECHRMADYVLEDFTRYLNDDALKYEVHEDMLLTAESLNI